MDSTDKANNSPLGPARDRSTDSAVPVHSVGSAPRKVSSDFPPHHEEHQFLAPMMHTKPPQPPATKATKTTFLRPNNKDECLVMPTYGPKPDTPRPPAMRASRIAVREPSMLDFSDENEDPSAGPSETRSHSAEQEVGGSSKNDVVEHSAKASDNPGEDPAEPSAASP
ncbi:hypothetical protein AAVH_12273 [Aphelenchoides avenae]|nr:hypothetical protein AAVH_12273 [Aphelenchus avenae]